VELINSGPADEGVRLKNEPGVLREEELDCLKIDPVNSVGHASPPEPRARIWNGRVHKERNA